MPSRSTALLLCLLHCLLLGPLLAQPVQAQEAPARPKIGLVLSGGGARGLAHIGVLRVLQDLRVPVDLVVGTSMGALVGGAFASGRSVDELEAFVRSADWTAILADRPPRQDLSFRSREEDQLLPSRIEVGAKHNGITLPPAAAGNSALEFALERLVSGKRSELNIQQLALPFNALATDLLTGELMDLSDTPLFLAMRASMAVPGVFSPVRVKGRLVVDGGLVRNLGLETARAMGADIIIAVNVGTPLLEEKDLLSAVGVTNQMVNILTTQNVARSLRELRPSDVLIDPDLADLGFMDFSRREQALETGQRAANAAHERLRELSVPPAEYARHEQARLSHPRLQAKALPLASLTIEGSQRSNPEVLKAEMDLPLGQPVSQTQISQATAELYGRGDFDRLDTQIVDRDGQRHVTVQVSEAEWARSRLRLGLELYSNFDDASSFSLVLMHKLSWLNAWGGELRSLASIGSKRQLGSALFQPLGPGSAWYVEPSLRFDGGVEDVFDKGQRSARLGVSQSTASLAFGRRLGRWGDVQLGAGRLRASVRMQIPESAVASRVSAGLAYARLRVDTLDSMAFPSRGYLLDASISRVSDLPGPNITQFSITSLAAFHASDWAGHVYAEWSRASYGQATSLGGFLRLSGSPTSSVEGSNLGLSRLVLAKRIGQMPIGLGTAIRAGLSVELGGVVPEQQSLDLHDLRIAGSAFLSVDTRFGPFYLAAGSTKGRGSSLYLFLGPTW